MLTTEIDPSDKTTMNNTTKKPSDTGETLELPVIEKVQPLKKNPKHVVLSWLDDQLGHKLPASYMESSKDSNEVGRSYIDDYYYPLRFRDRKNDAKYDQVAPFMCAFLVSKKHRVKLFLSKQSVLFLCEIMRMHVIAVAVNEQGILIAKNVWKGAEALE